MARKKAAAPEKPQAAEVPEGDHVRTLAPERAVWAFIKEVLSTKNATSEVGQALSTATKRASDAGVNVPAARIAARILSKAKQDALKGRVLWEDTMYYLLQCTDFDQIAPTGMFSAREAGQERSQPGLSIVRDDHAIA